MKKQTNKKHPSFGASIVAQQVKAPPVITACHMTLESQLLHFSSSPLLMWWVNTMLHDSSKEKHSTKVLLGVT